MNSEQFSTEFDIAYNNITSNASPPLNEFEKSSFLTKAQNELLLIYYNGLNGRYTSFEATEECRRYLDSLVVRDDSLRLLEKGNIESFKVYTYEKPFITHNYINSLGEDIETKTDSLLFIVRESVEKKDTDGCEANKYMSVRPISYNDLTHCLRDPFKRPNSKKALRLDSSNGIDIVTSVDIDRYLCTYIKKPKPIILEDISQYGLNIDGYQDIQDPVCEFPEVMHQKIVDRAVMLAKAAYVGEFGTQSALSVQTL